MNIYDPFLSIFIRIITLEINSFQKCLERGGFVPLQKILQNSTLYFDRFIKYQSHSDCFRNQVF